MAPLSGQVDGEAAAKEGQPQAGAVAEPRDDLASKLARREVQRSPSSIPGREIVQVETLIPPGVESGWHAHPGEEVGYIIAGQVEMMVHGRATVVLRPGDGFLSSRGPRITREIFGPDTGRMRPHILSRQASRSRRSWTNPFRGRAFISPALGERRRDEVRRMGRQRGETADGARDRRPRAARRRGRRGRRRALRSVSLRSVRPEQRVGHLAVPRRPRPRGRRPGHRRRPECQGAHGRPARRRRLELGQLHALSPVHVGKPSPLPASATDDRRASRRVREPRPRALGVDDPAAGEAELRRRRAAAVRRHHRLHPAGDVRQADRAASASSASAGSATWR